MKNLSGKELADLWVSSFTINSPGFIIASHVQEQEQHIAVLSAKLEKLESEIEKEVDR